MSRAPFFAFIFGVSFAAFAQEGRLVAVRVRGDAISSAVELVGNRPLSFTTLELQSPPRIVVDFAGAVVAGAPAEVSVEDGTIRRVATAAAGAHTARVVIELAADAEFDVRANGNAVVVRVPRISPRLAAAQGGKGGLLAQNTAGDGGADQATAAGQTTAGDGGVEQAEVRNTAGDGGVESEAQKRASLPTVSLVGSRPASADERAGAAPPKPASERPEHERKSEAPEAHREIARETAVAEHATAEKRAAAEKLAAEKTAAAERRAAVAAEKRAAADKLAAEKKAAAERRAAEKRGADEKIAAEKKAASERRAEQKRAAAEKVAAEKKTAAERRAALALEKRAGAKKVAADKKAVAQRRAAEKRAAAEKLAAEKKAVAQRRAEDKRAAAEKLAAQKKAAADRRAAAAAEKRAAAEKGAAAKRAAAEKATADAAAAKRAAAEQATADAAAAKRAAAEKAAAEKRVRAAAAAEAAARRSAAQAPPPLLTPEEAKALREAAERGLPTGLGQTPAAPANNAATKERRVARAEARSGIAIHSIGFRPAGGGELVVRSERPLDYGITGEERAVVLHLPHATIPRHSDRLPLDTHFFEGPVARVVPVQTTSGVDLRIELRARAEYQVSQDGGVLTVAFSAAR